MMYEKIDPGHAPAATEEPVDRACSCTCNCNCNCQSGSSATNQGSAEGRKSISDLQKEALVPT